MHTKAGIFNLALGALLLSRKIIDTATDKSNECTVLNTHWDVALSSTLEDLDLDSTSSTVTLELLEEDPNSHWKYAYRYPTNCAHLRRIVSCALTDNRTTQIPKRVGIHEAQQVVFTNKEEAEAEIIPTDLPLSALSANAGLAIAYRLAVLSAPLATGKGAKDLIKRLEDRYILLKAEAQEKDRRENFNFVDSDVESEFVEERLS